MPSSSEIAKVMAEMDRFNKPVTVTEERYEKRVASVGGSYGGLTALLQQGAPGNWASDHKSEAEKFSGWHYVAITSIGKAVRSCEVEAYQEKVREYAKGYNEQDEDTTPLPKWHPLMKLLKRPNPNQSGASFREEMAIQLCLTGSALVWNVPNQMGRCVERYVIPTAIAEPRQPEKGLPKGGWYINPEVARWQIESGWFLYSGLAQAIGKVIDARDVQVVRFIHPVFKDEGQSPVSAGALWTDTSEKIDISRHAHLRNGSDPSVIIGIDGVEDEGTLQRMSAKFNEKYAGPSKHGKAMFVNGQNVKVEPVTRTPAEMAYEGAFSQFRDAIMALHGVTPIAAGIEAPSGDDGLYAPLKQFVVGTVQPILDLMAEEDTEQLAAQFGEGVSIHYTAKAIDDAKLTEQQINTDIAAGAIEVDEIRKLRGRKPWGGEKGKAVAGHGAKEEAKPGLPGLAQGVPGLEPQTGPQALDPSKPPQGTPDPMKLAEEAVAKALGGFADRLSALLKSGGNCGTGAGGFKPGNDCAGGGGEGGDKPAKKKRGKKVAEETAGPKIEAFERGTGEYEFTSRGELIRGKIGYLPITVGEPGLIDKLSKKTKAGIESAMTDPDIIEDMKAGGIEALNIQPTNYYKKRTGLSGNWYGGYANGELTIHPKTVDHIEASSVQERVGGGLKRVISHEAGHGVWETARDADKKAFAEALKKNPEIVSYVSSVVNVKADPNAFSNTGSRVVTESFAEIHALRRYNREMYDSLSEDIRNPIESAHKFGLELNARMAKFGDRLKPKWQKSGSDCGANGPGGGGFQRGNTCGRGDGSGEDSGGKPSKKKPTKKGKAKGVLAWAEEKFGDTEKAKNFADWFGGSKAVDAKGNPVVYYHGTSSNFSEFDTTGSSDFGSHFGTSTQANDFTDAEGSRVIPVYLSVQNPLELPDLERWNFESMSQALSEHGIAVEDSPYKIETADMGENYRRKYRRQFENIASAMEAAGYDSIVYRNEHEGDKKSYSYIVLRPHQVKSALANSGKFDATSGDISKTGDNCGANAQGGGGFQPGNTCAQGEGSEGSDEPKGRGGSKPGKGGKVYDWALEKFKDEETARNFTEWFGDSKVVDEDGSPLVVYHGTTGDFTEFNPRASVKSGTEFGNGIYLTTDPERAALYASDDGGSIKPLYLKAENVLDRDGELSESQAKGVSSVLSEDILPEDLSYHTSTRATRSFSDKDEARAFYQQQKQEWDGSGEGISRYKPSVSRVSGGGKEDEFRVEYSDKANVSIMRGGRDAISQLMKTYGNDYTFALSRAGIDAVRVGDIYVVTSPNQIKSATGNSGKFDPKDPNITKSGSDCGANAEGGGGFQPRNTCGREDGGEGEGGSSASAKKKQKATEKEIGKWVQLGTELQRATGWSLSDLMDEAEKQGDRKAQIKWMEKELDSRRSGEFAEARKQVQPHLDRVREKVAEAWDKEMSKMPELARELADAKAKQEELQRKHVDLFLAHRKMRDTMGQSEEELAEFSRLGKEMDEANKDVGKQVAIGRKIWEKKNALPEKAREKVAEVLRKESLAVMKDISPELASQFEQTSKAMADFVKYDYAVRDAGNSTELDKKVRAKSLATLSKIANPEIHQDALKAGIVYQEGARASAYSGEYSKKFLDLVNSGVSYQEAAKLSIAPSYSVFSPGSEQRVYVHEYGHQIEYGNREANAFTRGFLESRTKGDKIEPFAEKFGMFYSDDEKGADDNFIHAFDAVFPEYRGRNEAKAFYTGKLYDRETTEILPMGLELFHENPKAFAEADPEWFDLVTGALTGRLLVKTQKQMKAKYQ